MTWAGAVLYWGTTPRSPQGHLKVTAVKGQTEKTPMISSFLSILSNPFGVQVSSLLQMTAVDTFFVGYHFTTHRKGFACNFSLGVITPLVFPN